MAGVPAEAGKSSFDLVDREALFAALPLEAAGRVVDLGCGAGRYALALAGRLGPSASLHGVDLWPEGVERLLRDAREQGLANVTAETADVAVVASLGSGTVDLALFATVLHDLAERGAAAAALVEAARVLRPGGCLAVVEFRKIDARPGPPLSIRLSPAELGALVEPAGFTATSVRELGPHLYLALYCRSG